jgi:hypothetical protein
MEKKKAETEKKVPTEKKKAPEKAADTEKMIKAYCLKTKEKNVPMYEAVVTKTAKGGYMATGNDGKGNKMAAIMGEAKALQAIKDGVATKGF